MALQGPQLKSYSVEVSIHNFILKGTFMPRSDFVVFINDTENATYPFSDSQLMPLMAEYQVPGIRHPLMNLNRDLIAFISALDSEETEDIQFVQASRRVVFYTEWFAIRAQLHVHGEARDDDLLDTNHDFFALTNAEIHPLRSISAPVQRRVPTIFINRHRVLAYNVQPA